METSDYIEDDFKRRRSGKERLIKNTNIYDRILHPDRYDRTGTGK